MIDQVELNPFITREELASHCATAGIAMEAYSPLTKGVKLADPTVVAIGAAHGKSAAQVMIRWCLQVRACSFVLQSAHLRVSECPRALQRGYIVIPKSSSPARIRENADVFDFALSGDEMASLNALDEYLVTGWDPTRAP